MVVSAGAPPPGPPPEDAPTLYETDAPTLEGRPPPDAPPPGGPPGDRALWPWLLLLLVLVVGGVIAAIVFLGGGNGKKGGSGTGPVNTKTGTILVPSVIGMRGAQARARLEHLGLTVASRPQRSREAAGVVLGQNPKPGTRLARGALVGLVVSSGPPQAGVPNVAGLTAAEAASKLQAAGLHATTKQVAALKPAGTVVAQTPAAGAKLVRGATVALTVSKGPARVSVPDVVGLARAAAERKVRAAGLTSRAVTVPSTGPAGKVVAQSPPGGSSLTKGANVRLSVSQGTNPGGGGGTTGPKPARVKVPDVVGRQQAAAQRALAKAGLRSRVTYVVSQQPEGTVVSQIPKAGTTVGRNSHVTLKVSLGPNAPQQTAVPDVVGEDQATATSDLQNAGLVVQVVEQDTTDPSQDGIVLDQDPAGGTNAPSGATVTIVVGRSPSG